MRSKIALLLVAACCAGPGGAQARNDTVDGGLDSELRPLLERYRVDSSALRRAYSVPMSSRRDQRMEEFYREWLERLEQVPFDSLGQEGRVDFLLFRNRLRYGSSQVAFEARRDAEVAHLLPFAPIIVELLEAHQRMEPVDGRVTADRLTELGKQIDAARGALGKGKPAKDRSDAERIVANRAAERADSLQRALRRWHRFYDGYDPMFGWWTKKPFESADGALRGHARFLRDKLVGVQQGDDPVIGDPIGRDALLLDLAQEMIPYNPEELIEIAEQEFAWCDAEMAKASRELGFGEDWRAAQDHVKNLFVEPGSQPELIRELAHEAVRFLEERDLVTIPELCKEIWRREMMSPERQKVSPYFLGGETIIISFPTDEMEHQDKLMSLRGNNIHFSRATVHHELIPGHHLQGFMLDRHATWRRPFRTPFWLEGWALYWEMLLWDQGFPRSAEDRVGMLFWRKHRCARIIFSLKFHLGLLSAQEAIDFLVERVGHERNNATAEVRRSVNGSYPPLYQCAYMLGGLQFRALHEALVGTGEMSNREFHDAILTGHSMPVEMVRARLTGQTLEREFRSTWRFRDG